MATHTTQRQAAHHRWRGILGWTPAGVAVAGVLLAAFLILRPSSANPGLVGQAAPNFSLPDLAGRTVQLSSLRGHPVLINFWGVSCPPCRREVPLLQAAWQQYRSKGLVILGLDAQGDDRPSVDAFASERNVTYTMLIDPQNTVAPRYGVKDLPESFLVDRSGIVRRVDPAPFLDPGPLNAALTNIL